MKTITCEFTDKIPDTTEEENPPEGFRTEDQREGTQRRIFNMCIVKAENEGLPNKFQCERTFTEEKKKVMGSKWIEITCKAVFTEIA